MNDDAVPLLGGREGTEEGSIERVGDQVHRPGGAWSTTVFELLAYVRAQGCLSVPEPISLQRHSAESGEEIVREQLSYLPGHVIADWSHSDLLDDQVVVSIAALLRRYHDASVGFLEHWQQSYPHTPMRWQHPAREPAEVVCHGDVAPYNCTITDGVVSGLFDFDTAHPGPRVRDVAYAIYRWAPLSDPDRHVDVPGDINWQCHRTRVFCDAYGLSPEDRRALVDVAVDRLRVMLDYMRAQADAGSAVFRRHFDEGHDQVYEADMRYLRLHAPEILRAVA